PQPLAGLRPPNRAARRLLHEARPAPKRAGHRRRRRRLHPPQDRPLPKIGTARSREYHAGLYAVHRTSQQLALWSALASVTESRQRLPSRASETRRKTVPGARRRTSLCADGLG